MVKIFCEKEYVYAFYLDQEFSSDLEIATYLFELEITMQHNPLNQINQKSQRNESSELEISTEFFELEIATKIVYNV